MHDITKMHEVCLAILILKLKCNYRYGHILCSESGCKISLLPQMEELKILTEIYEGCTEFDPIQRLTVSKVVDSLPCLDDHLDAVPLGISQNSAMEKYDMLVAAERELEDDPLLGNAINACSFISIVLGRNRNFIRK